MIEDKRDGGFGLYIIRRSVDRVEYESDPVKGNTLRLIKRIA
jgi:anti-sigma regulatory factor (Ser/Thr protein kinase)